MAETTTRFVGDLDAGKALVLKFPGCAREIRVVSCRGDGPRRNRCDWVANGTGDVIAVEGETDRFVKRKHYYVYSATPNYGKTRCAKSIVGGGFNAGWVRDVKDWSDVSDRAQFLVIDDYGCGGTNCFDASALRRIASGDAGNFSGKCKGNDPFVPRSDAQLIIFSNYHPFDVMGKYDRKSRRRTLHPIEAAGFSARFHVIKLDEEETGVSEERDRRRHTAPLPPDAGDDDDGDERPSKRRKL